MKFSFIMFFSVILNLGYGQDNFIQIETSKTLCLFSFLETSIGQNGTSSSFQEYIGSHLKEDEEFIDLLKLYSGLNLDYSSPRQEYPDTRHSNLSSKNLIWVAASNSSSIADFSERITGYLPHNTHAEFISVLEKAEPIYDAVIWDKEQVNIQRIKSQLIPYTKEIADLFITISRFYNTTWDTKVPFKISVYPIPLELGVTTAIPMGNALICGFLSHKVDDYKSLLGIAVHEMCHILYGEQSPKFQHEIEEWYLTSPSSYRKLAYSYLDEGLATALGNGWAYEQMNNKVDEGEWYNNEHIDGFGHALFPLVKEYISKNKQIDEAFIEKSIALFERTFPKATRDVNVLMNEIQLYANTEVESELDQIANYIQTQFNIRSMWFSSPINDEKTIETFSREHTTKVFVIDSKNTVTLKLLKKYIPEVNVKMKTSAMHIFKDETTESTAIVINIDGIAKLESVLIQLSSMKYVEFGKSYKFI